MVETKVNINDASAQKFFSTKLTSPGSGKSKLKSTVKDQVDGSKNGSQIKKKPKISEKGKQNDRGNKKSANYVAKSERKEENYEYIMNGNIDNKNDAREAFAKVSKDKETVTEVDDDMVKNSTANPLVISDKAPIL